MVLKMIAVTDFADIPTSPKYEEGSRFCDPATSKHGEQELMYIRAVRGTAGGTNTSHNVMVPYSVSAEWDGWSYGVDKTDLTDNLGKFSVIPRFGVATAATVYGLAIVKGPTFINYVSTTSIKSGNVLTATAAGTDRIAEKLKVTLSAPQTMSTNDVNLLGAGGFAVARDTVAVATSQLPVMMTGF